MALQLNIDYQQVIALIDQMSSEQQQALIERLLTQREQKSLTAQEKIQLLDAVKLHNPIHAAPSVRREDWYGDDGR
ncbi:hypothetical protein HC776_02000 [bacterium]|nr:hypothetical protein [bacterium]